MIDFSIVGPILGVFAVSDVVIHLHLDVKKSKATQGALFREPSTEVPSSTIFAIALSTLLSFFLVLCIPIVWLFQVQETFLYIQIPYLVDVPIFLWSIGFGLLLLGIVIHTWSRYVRQEMAPSWMMRDDHKLITGGPYARIRHPSYSSYFMCFIGLFLMMPSVITTVLFIGILGYYRVAVLEEKNLLQHFGEAYNEYMGRTGRFFPRIL